ncbi:hypothetical protein DM02DRAFT_248630 [Periconia macrospinosa]|uniref:Uncharacterized protein n=1 Tax=Periconia macrospinosa TaxID=97972 RepID=A0A2V1D582_9PLEO|nr:hypothetical protein DM02DRAFT_248630 [Periconia macrospinosa]
MTCVFIGYVGPSVLMHFLVTVLHYADLCCSLRSARNKKREAKEEDEDEGGKTDFPRRHLAIVFIKSHIMTNHQKNVKKHRIHNCAKNFGYEIRKGGPS